MNQSKAEAIVTQLLTNATGLRYGSVSVSAKLHDGRVVEVSYSRTEQTRDAGFKKDVDMPDGIKIVQPNKLTGGKNGNIPNSK